MYGKHKSQSIVISLVALVMMAVTPAMGSVVYIDFAAAVGSPTGPDGAVWNVIGAVPGSPVGLVTIGNENSGFTMELTHWLSSGTPNTPPMRRCGNRHSTAMPCTIITISGRTSMAALTA